MTTATNCSATLMIALCLVVTCGCGTFPMRREVNSPGIETAVFKAYSGARLPADKTARIITSSRGGAAVSKLDGRSISMPPWPMSWDGWEEIVFEVLPGVHHLHVVSPRELIGSYGNMRQYQHQEATLSFTADAGGAYSLVGDTNALLWSPSITLIRRNKTKGQ